MASKNLAGIEAMIRELPDEDRVLLIEHLVHPTHVSSPDPQGDESLGERLAAMARDPEIQSELMKIEREFAVTEGDGLGYPG